VRAVGQGIGMGQGRSRTAPGAWRLGQPGVSGEVLSQEKVAMLNELSGDSRE